MITINPDYLNVKVGDVYLSRYQFDADGNLFRYISTVTEVRDVHTIFDKTDRFVMVSVVRESPDGDEFIAERLYDVNHMLRGLM